MVLKIIVNEECKNSLGYTIFKRNQNVSDNLILSSYLSGREFFEMVNKAHK